MHRRFPPLALGALVVVAVAIAVVGRGSPYEGQVGLSSHLTWTPQTSPEGELRKVRAGGVEWVREDFRWDWLEPRRGEFDWRRTDALMAAAARAEVDVLGVLAYSAPWASSDPSGNGDIHFPPRDPADFARYARRVVERYGEGGRFWKERPKLPERALAAVELWNEPFGSWFWKPNPDPAAYARLAKRAATAVKAAQPEIDVLVAGDPVAFHAGSSEEQEWLAPMLEAEPGLASVIDAYATHPYPEPKNRGPRDNSMPPPYRFDRARLTREIAARHHVEKPIWITEVGWSSAPESEDAVTEDQQARFLADGVVQALKAQRIERIFVYTWDRSSGKAGDREGNYGLRRADGAPKPAWTRLSSLLGA